MESLLAYQGVVSNPTNALGAPDGNGAYFCRGNSGKYTGAVWSLPCNLPSGTKLKIRIKVPSGTAYFKVFGAKDMYAYGSDYTLIASKYVCGSSYRDICVTTNGDFNIINKGCSPFKIDAITYEKTCTATYAWSSGETTKSITVSPTETTDYVLTASLCGSTLKDTIKVMVKDCSSGDPVCTKKIRNNTGCVSKPFIFYLRDKSGGDHYLSGDTNNYVWEEYANGDMRLKATGLSTSTLTGSFDIDFTFSGNTTTPPTGSPRYSACFTVSTTTDWEYFTTTSGTIKSTNYGNMTVSRKGQATQLGVDANIFQAGYGASGWVNIAGGSDKFSYGDFNLDMEDDCISDEPTCSKVVGNTRGCSNKPYVIWLRDKNGSAHYLKGDSSRYNWYEYDNGDAKLIAKGLSASGLSGTFNVELNFTGHTNTPPTNSPKYSNCFTAGSTSAWGYFNSTSGTITSTNYGSMTVSRKGPAAQIGDGANITQDGYGASGWFNITGGAGYFPNGDFNVMLSGCILPGLEAKVCADDTLSICIDDLVNLDSIYGEDVVVQSSTSSNAGSSVMVETGSYTSGVDCCNGNKPNAITYQYVSSNKINNSQTNSNVTTYTAPGGRKVLIVVSGNSNASDTSNALYRGLVNAGERFTVLRNQSKKWQANHYLRIMSADGSSLLQFSNIHISCSQPLISGEQYGTIVISSVTVDGSTCSGGAPDCESSLTYVPAPGFTGLDTVIFEVCTSGANKWCADIPVVVNVEKCDMTPDCKVIVGNTRGCSNKPYVIYLVDKNGSAHHLSGDSTDYQWKMYTNGDVQFIGKDLSAPGLSGNFDVDLLFSGVTTTPPVNSPKYSSCFTVSSVSGWKYYSTTTGSIASTNYGTMAITRQGPAFHVGDGANITQDGFGGSGWLAVSGGTGHIKAGDINIMLTEECEDPQPECERVVANTRGCAGKPYVIWLKDKNGAAHHLKGDSTKYQWLSYNNGDVKFIANDISASGLSGTFDVDLLFSGRTLTPPTNSPKNSNCFTVGSNTGWVYFETTEGTITSTSYGDMTISRAGPAFQMGDGANITQDGFGASGWLAVAGGNGHIKSGDINVMLSEDCSNEDSECDETHNYDPCIITYGKGSYNRSSTTILITQTVSEIKEIVVEGIYKGGKPTSGSFTNGTNTVTWSGSDAKALDNVSGTSDKGYYKGTLPAASSVTMNVSNNQSKMHGMAAYVVMKDEFCADNFTSVSDERYYTYQNTNNTSFSMPATINTKNITAVLPIAEMNNDSRIATFTLTAGGESESVTINSYDLGRSMTLQSLSLNDIPGNVTSATLTMSSPNSNGDSYVTGSAMFNWYLPCETNDGKNRIAGTVFFDADRDTTLDNAEDGEPNVMVYLYDDKDDDGVLDDNELDPIDSVLTGTDGTYEFLVDFVCNEGYINNVEYQYSIDNPSNLLGAPGTNFATYNNNADNLIVELDGRIKDGEEYSIYLKAIESGAYAIISESTDGINFYHNTNIAITSSSKGEYTITADRDVNYIKFDKNTINTISGYNTNGSTTTNYADYAIYGVQFCKEFNSYIIETNLNTYPDETELTTDNYESAQFDGPNQEDLGNDYGFYRF
ncbi:MAG: hypothetical protein KC517_05080 [Bacteroidetes bacterium]|nr:hypothetical protein [Bacteroidota bacterium]